MRILVTGKGGKSGAWKIRGGQLGEAIGATVKVPVDPNDCSAVDLIVGVKRVPAGALSLFRDLRKPWVWDVVDPWPQPIGNAWPKEEAIAWLHDAVQFYAPRAIVFPTTRMWLDSGWTGPHLILPHHAYPPYKPNEIRKGVYVVGYEGSRRYLGKWQKALDEETSRRGWIFAINNDMTQTDIGVALRDVEGYASPAWKSNVKLANLQALGIPAICSPEEGYKEFSSGSEVFVTTQKELSDALTALASQKVRAEIGQKMATATIPLERVAKTYLKWLQTLA